MVNKAFTLVLFTSQCDTNLTAVLTGLTLPVPLAPHISDAGGDTVGHERDTHSIPPQGHIGNSSSDGIIVTPSSPKVLLHDTLDAVPMDVDVEPVQDCISISKKRFDGGKSTASQLSLQHTQRVVKDRPAEASPVKSSHRNLIKVSDPVEHENSPPSRTPRQDSEPKPAVGDSDAQSMPGRVTNSHKVSKGSKPPPPPPLPSRTCERDDDLVDHERITHPDVPRQQISPDLALMRVPNPRQSSPDTMDVVSLGPVLVETDEQPASGHATVSRSAPIDSNLFLPHFLPSRTSESEDDPVNYEPTTPPDSPRQSIFANPTLQNIPRPNQPSGNTIMVHDASIGHVPAKRHEEPTSRHATGSYTPSKDSNHPLPRSLPSRACGSDDKPTALPDLALTIAPSAQQSTLCGVQGVRLENVFVKTGEELASVHATGSSNILECPGPLPRPLPPRTVGHKDALIGYESDSSSDDLQMAEEPTSQDQPLVDPKAPAPQPTPNFTLGTVEDELVDFGSTLPPDMCHQRLGVDFVSANDELGRSLAALHQVERLNPVETDVRSDVQLTSRTDSSTVVDGSLEEADSTPQEDMEKDNMSEGSQLLSDIFSITTVLTLSDNDFILTI